MSSRFVKNAYSTIHLTGFYHWRNLLSIMVLACWLAMPLCVSGQSAPPNPEQIEALQRELDALQSQMNEVQSQLRQLTGTGAQAHTEATESEDRHPSRAEARGHAGRN